MDWFHCNRCFRQDGARFAVTSCGHILCQACVAAGPCPICGADCRVLPISEQMRPEEKLFFKNPAAIAVKRLNHIAQVWRFQRAQTDLLWRALQSTRQLLQAREREAEALRRENSELRRAQLSPAWRGGSRSSTPRPVGVTSPAQTVTPQGRRQLSGQVVRYSRSTPLESPSSSWDPHLAGGHHPSRLGDTPDLQRGLISRLRPRAEPQERPVLIPHPTEGPEEHPAAPRRHLPCRDPPRSSRR